MLFRSNGATREKLQDVLSWRQDGESAEESFIRVVVEKHWAGAASDMYAAHSMGLPLGLGVGLEARLASLRQDSLNAADVAFRLRLPVIDGLPPKELIALRGSEHDAFQNFQDTLTSAIKSRIATADPAADDVDDLAREIQEDTIYPALHKIQQRLHAAESVLQRNHRYNIALAGLTTVCGLVGPPDLTIALIAANVTTSIMTESQFISERSNISQEGMYFLWKAMEYSDKTKHGSTARKRRAKRSR